MNYDFFRQIIKELPRYMRVGLTYGGESIMHPEFAKFLAYAQQKHFRDLNVYTNGLAPYPKGVRTVQGAKPPWAIIGRNFKFESGRIPPLQDLKRCHFLYDYIAVLWNGNITPCCHDVGGHNVIANLPKEYFTLHGVWHGWRYQELRKKGYCEGCEIWKHGL